MTRTQFHSCQIKLMMLAVQIYKGSRLHAELRKISEDSYEYGLTEGYIECHEKYQETLRNLMPSTPLPTAAAQNASAVVASHAPALADGGVL